MLTNSFSMRMITLFERLRTISVAVGLFFALWFPAEGINYLVLGVVLPMSGLLAVEGLFFRHASAQYKKRTPSVYQYQTAFFFVALFLVSIGVFCFDVAISAKITLIMILLLFFLQSSLVHLKEFFAGKGRLHLWRFVGSISMWCIVGWVLFRYFHV